MNISLKRNVSDTLLELQGQLLFLPIELEEHFGLVTQDVRLDRLVEKIDGAKLVALEGPAPIAGARGDKDDRYCRVRSLPRMSSASSKPSMSGIWTSTSASATSWTSRSSSASAPGSRLEQLDVVAAQQRREGDEVLLEVVDEQTLDLHRVRGLE